jgi:hypothetical protein
VRTGIWPTLLLVGLLVPLRGFAEAPPPAAPGYNPAARYNLPTNQGLDGDFFAPKPPAPPVTPGPAGRYAAGEPDYNSAQREEWLKKCEKENTDGEAFRKCYAREKAKTLGELEVGRQKVQDNQGTPFQNSSSKSLPSLENREPAFGGVKKD